MLVSTSRKIYPLLIRVICPFMRRSTGTNPFFLLLTDKDYANLEVDAKKSAQTLSSANTGKKLGDYAVVLFLEAGELNLKNCDMFDCNNRGEKMTLNPRALLVKKSDIPELKKTRPAIPQGLIPATKTSIPGLSASAGALQPSVKFAATSKTATIGAVKGSTLSGFISAGIRPLNPFSARAPEINLKRFNVPYTDLKTTDDVIKAFIKLVDDTTLSAVAGALNYCYDQYKEVLDADATGFPDLFNTLKAHRDAIIKSYPIFIQYFYDFIDDLVKAYYEFRVKVSQLLSACCPR